MSVVNNEIWRELIEELKDCPELWQAKNNKYKNKDLKHKAWERLLKIYLKIDSGATILSLKNKINNIRACYRRELIKQKKSEKSGAGADEIHVPALWYFDLMSFLKDNKTPIAGTSSMDSDDNTEEIEIDHIPPKIKKTGKLSLEKKEEFLKTAVDHLKERKEKKTKDEAEVFSSSWAVSFRKLSETQQIYAKNAIEQILIMGQLNQLTLNVVANSASSSSTNSPYMLSRSSTPLSNVPTSYVPSNSRQAAAIPTSDTSVTYYSLQDLFSDTQYA